MGYNKEKEEKKIKRDPIMLGGLIKCISVLVENK